MAKIDKYNTTIKLLGIATTLLLLTPALTHTQLQVASAQTNTTSDISDECMDKIETDIHSKGSSLDSTKATSLAANNDELKSRTRGYISKFNSIFTIWTFDTTSCTATLMNVNVVYSLYNDASYVKNEVVTLDPSLTKVKMVTEHVGAYFGTTYSTNWSGYEFKASSTASVPIYESKATWTVPSVSEPWSYACFFTHCDLGIWTGLEDTLGATNSHLAQGGSDSGIYCTAGCSFFYYGWYEFLPNPLVQCTGMPVSPGDSFRTTVTNQAKNGGSSSLYNIVVENLSRRSACGVTNYSYSSMTSPKYGTFINERPSFFEGTARLPQFSSDTMTGTIYYSGSSKSIYTPYFNGWYEKDIMRNGGNDNISVSSVSGGGSFSQTYVTSNGT